jgi:hypothetical protein
MLEVEEMKMTDDDDNNDDDNNDDDDDIISRRNSGGSELTKVVTNVVVDNDNDNDGNSISNSNSGNEVGDEDGNDDNNNNDHRRITKIRFKFEEGDEEAPSLPQQQHDDNIDMTTSAITSSQNPNKGKEENEEEEENPIILPKVNFTKALEHSSREYVYVVCLGLAMAFIAGYSNGVCLSGYIHVNTRAVKQSVAGVTGLYTMSAIALGDGKLVTHFQFLRGFCFVFVFKYSLLKSILYIGNKSSNRSSSLSSLSFSYLLSGDFDAYRFHVGTLLSVMVGACIASIMNPRPVAFELSPKYGQTFLIGFLFSMLGAIAAVHNYKREFYFTAIGNGVMNGISSMYTANLIRTTHLTGTTTDIGLFIGQFLRGNRSNLWKLYILAGLATSFWIGSLTGYEASRFKRNNALIMNAAFFFAMGCSIIIYFMFGRHKLSFFDAIFGIGKFSIKFEKITIRRRRDGNGGEGNGNDNNDVDDINNDDDDIDDDEDNYITSSSRMTMVPEKELLAIFDTLDKNSDGRVNQDQLMDVLASNDIKIKKRRKSLFSILASVFDEHHDVDGDWTIRREDWKRLVRQESIRESLRQSSSRFVSFGGNPNNSVSSLFANDDIDIDIDIDIDNSIYNQNKSLYGQGRRSSSSRRNSRTNNDRKSDTNSARSSIDRLRRSSIQEIESSGYHVKQYQIKGN